LLDGSYEFDDEVIQANKEESDIEMGFDDDGIRYGPTSMPKEVLVGLTKIRVSPSVLTIFQNGFFHAVCKHFLHISCAHKTYVVTRNFVVDCLEHENL